MRDDHHRGSCGDGCCSDTAERNRYFTGKYLTARDLVAEQDYFLGRHRLHNRLLHGWGVVCGYGVTPHPDPRCADWVVVGPGVALDCSGRELVLDERTPFRVEPGEQRQLLICATYREEEVEHVPVIYDECGCDPRRREANRVRETVALELHPLDDVDARCWSRPGGGQTLVHDDCDGELPAAGGGCVEPDCPCGDLVPLALVTVTEDGSLEIDDRGRRTLPAPPDTLTRVCETSWEHGGTVPLDKLREAGRLWLAFTRRIEPAEGIATGINEETVLVQHAGEGDDLKYVPYDAGSPPRLEDDRYAVYDIDPGFLNPARRGGALVGSTVYVTVYADFVLDCHGRAVDGGHLGGRAPSGRGVPGGTFRSWFRVGAESSKGYPGEQGQEEAR